MRILFLENRTKTRLWEQISPYLEQAGHEVHWLVQNPVFRPRASHVCTLPFPPRSDNTPAPPPEVSGRVSASDRSVNYFGRDTSHYGWYWTRIGEVLDDVVPDVVFGEATLFHELLAIEASRARGIPYLHPSSNRYPPGRTSFYLYDTLEPFGGTDEKVSEEEAEAWIRSIGGFAAKPSYMVTPTTSIGRLRTSAAVRRDQALAALGWVLGERFNTPSPAVKKRLEQNCRRRLEVWDATSVPMSSDRTFVGTVLYPMHMQPEANLDVWGRDRRDQAAVVRTTLGTLPEDWRLLVKANPKPKYEIQDELLALRQENPERLVFLKRATPMKEVLRHVDLVVTVTGTVGIEAMMSDTPVVTLVPQMINECPQARMIEDFTELADLLTPGEAAPRIRLNEKSDRVNLITRLAKTSYPGHVTDPTRNELNPENLRLLVEGFEDVLDKASRWMERPL